MSGKYNILNVDRVEENINAVSRNTFGVFICNQGQADVMLGEKLYRLERNVLLFYTPYAIVKVMHRTSDFSGLLLEEEMDILFATISGIPMKRRILLRDYPCIRISQGQRERIEEMISVIDRREALMNECPDQHNAELVQRVVVTLIQALCFEMVEIYFACSQVEDVPQTKETRTYSQFISAAFAECDKHRTVAHYAAQAHLSPGHFTTLVRNVSGITPLKWIETLAMSRAKKYLADNSLSIKEVAARMNFPDQSAFGRYFRSREGVSPSQYRLQLKTNVPW